MRRAVDRQPMRLGAAGKRPMRVHLVGGGVDPDDLAVRGAKTEPTMPVLVVSLGEAPIPAVGGSAGAASLRGNGLRMKASKVCSTRLLNILSASRARF